MRAHTQKGEGLIVPGTEKHERLFEVRTRTYARDNCRFSSLERMLHSLNYIPYALTVYV